MFFAELVNLGEFSDNAVNSESLTEIGMFSFVFFLFQLTEISDSNSGEKTVTVHATYNAV